MFISTKDFYEVGWFIFKLFALYRIISAACAIAFSLIKFKLDEKKDRKTVSAPEVRKEILNKIEPLHLAYKRSEIGFKTDTIRDKEP